jgi:hypothetical protein
MVAGFELAHINVARFRRPIEDAANADFVAALAGVNAGADAAPGFVWRMLDEDLAPEDLAVFDDPLVLVNMSVWRDLQSLRDFTYGHAGHRAMLGQRAKWFEHVSVSLALWWVKAGHRPGLAEGRARLDILAKVGPSEKAFTFAQNFGVESAIS